MHDQLGKGRRRPSVNRIRGVMGHRIAVVSECGRSGPEICAQVLSRSKGIRAASGADQLPTLFSSPLRRR